jgi:hypothetical protein
MIGQLIFGSYGMWVIPDSGFNKINISLKSFFIVVITVFFIQNTFLLVVSESRNFDKMIGVEEKFLLKPFFFFKFE